MRNANENIITVTGTADNLFDKAIFILKPEVQEDVTSVDFVNEADKIITNFMMKTVAEVQKTKTNSNPNIIVTQQKTQTKKPKYTKQDATIDRLLAFAMLFCGIVIMYILLTI